MDFFQTIYEWFTVDIYQFVLDLMAYLTFKLIYMKIHFMIWLYSFAWSVASLILEDLNLGLRLSTALSFIPASLKAHLEFFNVFTGLGWIFQSLTTKFVMNFLR